MDALLLAAAMMVGQTAAAPKPQLTMPPQVHAKAGKIFTIKAEHNLKWVRWTIPPGLERVDPAETALGDKGFVGYGLTNGMYHFKVEGTLNDQYVSAETTLYIGTPTPPGPGPGPGPAPVPNDVLMAKLQAAYDKAGADRSIHRDALIDVYATAIRVATNPNVRPGIKTTGQFFEELRLVSAAMVGDTNLREVRTVLAECCADFAGGDKPLDDETRRALAGCLQRALDLVKGLR